MTSTLPSSFAASCAPLLAASKKPLPSDFGTRPIAHRVGCHRRSRKAEHDGHARRNDKLAYHRFLLPLTPPNRSGSFSFVTPRDRAPGPRRGRARRSISIPAASSGFSSSSRAPSSVTTNVDPGQRHNCHRRAAAQFAVVRHDDDTLGPLQELALALDDERVGLHPTRGTDAVGAGKKHARREMFDRIALERTEDDIVFAVDRAARQGDAGARSREKVGRDRKRVGRECRVRRP